MIATLPFSPKGYFEIHHENDLIKYHFCEPKCMRWRFSFKKHRLSSINEFITDIDRLKLLISKISLTLFLSIHR